MSGQEDRFRELVRRVNEMGRVKGLRQIQFTPPEFNDESYRKKIKRRRRSLARQIAAKAKGE